MLFLVKILLLLLHLCAATVEVSSGKVVYCYWKAWEYRNSSGSEFTSHKIGPHLCTHICYQFLKLTRSGNLYIPGDMDSDLKKAVALKKINPNLKLILGVSGSAEQYFAIGAEKDPRRIWPYEQYLSAVKEFLLDDGFDGIDIPWNTTQRQLSLEGSDEYIKFLKDLYDEFLRNKLLLIFSVDPVERLTQPLYNISEVSKYLSLINVHTYDFHSPWNKSLGHNAPLRGDDQNTVAASIEYWISQGVPRSKIVVTIPLFGRSFTMPPRVTSTDRFPAFINAHGFLAMSTESQYNTSVGAPSAGPGLPGPYLRKSGMLSYPEICSRISAWTTEWDEVGQVPFSYKGNQWITYENELSVTAKVMYIIEKDLAGAGVWSVEKDDFREICEWEKFFLLRTISLML